ncbi:MAG: imidazole glycerol phosphate synthase subunit HisH, partial [Chloroflexi bacterium]|nr:imidazole glycerol phosphate synthase subunit HisH [Chloroflexota bacterium]
MIALIDYGISNLRSVEKAFEHLGAPVTRTERPDDLRRAGRLILPGVGAFAAGMEGLRARGLVEPLRAAVRAGTPLLGICLGMQLLFEGSEEGQPVPGLGLLPGRVIRLQPAGGLPVPHMGWNQLNADCGVRNGEWGLLHGVAEGAYVYFVHSYVCLPANPGDVLATSDYGGPFASVVGRENTFGIQFH